MNTQVKQYLDTYGIKDTPELAEKGETMDDALYFYRIDDSLQGWYIKRRAPSNDKEELIIEILMTNYAPY